MKVNAHATIDPKDQMEFARLSAKLDAQILQLYGVAMLLGLADLKKLFAAKGGPAKIKKLLEDNYGKTNK